MKLLKTKIWTILCGLLTLNGLAMLFSGLIIQMDEVADFDSAQSLAVANSTNAIILAGIIMIVFFDGWATLKNSHAKHVKLV